MLYLLWTIQSVLFHQGLDCQTLRLIDEKVELEKQQFLTKSLNENAQIRSQK